MLFSRTSSEGINEEPAAVVADEFVVARAMTPDPICVRPQTTVLELVRLFHAKQFRHLLVTDEANRLVGIVSDRDVGRCFGPTTQPDERVLASISAGQILSADVVTIASDAPLATAVDRMYDEGVSCLPVVDGERLVGILTTTDLMHLLRSMLCFDGASRP